MLCVVSLAGEVPSVLARRALSQVPVLCGGPHGGVQHAPVHPPRVQSHRRQGEAARFSGPMHIPILGSQLTTDLRCCDGYFAKQCNIF